jgi:hypothetical protein
MRTLAVLIGAVVLAVGCGEDDEPAAPQGPFAELVVEVDADGEGAKAPKREEIRCKTAEDPPCAGLTAEVFEPTPRGTACTQEFGGPETATVTGTFGGRRVDAEFSRANGCEISRWEKAEPVLGRPG